MSINNVYHVYLWWNLQIHKRYFYQVLIVLYRQPIEIEVTQLYYHERYLYYIFYYYHRSGCSCFWSRRSSWFRHSKTLDIDTLFPSLSFLDICMYLASFDCISRLHSWSSHSCNSWWLHSNITQVNFVGMRVWFWDSST